MAENSSKRIKDFRAEIPRANEDFLGSIRDWTNIQIALENEIIWLKGFTEEQATSAEIQQLPNFILYELRDGLLFRKDALVPVKKMTTALLWNPISKALRLIFPIPNYNFFGIDGKINVQLTESEEEQPAIALLASFSQLNTVVPETPNFKLKPLQWITIDENALIIGKPILSFPGKTFWTKNDHLLPTGFDFEFKNLSVLLQKKHNPNAEFWLLWDKKGWYIPLPKGNFKTLSVSSFRITEKSQKWN